METKDDSWLLLVSIDKIGGIRSGAPILMEYESNQNPEKQWKWMKINGKSMKINGILKFIENSKKVNKIDNNQQCRRSFIECYATFIAF